MLSAGIVGLPNVGKSTLFNALTRTHKAPAENYPFCTIDPNLGIVTVPDARLAKLAEISHSQKIMPTAIEFVDIAGLVKGASAGEGLGNQFLHHIREVDAIVQVVRCFEDSDVHHVSASIDPIRDIEVINTELVLADLASLQKRHDRLQKEVRAGDKAAKIESAIIEKLLPHLDGGKPAITAALTPEEKAIARGFFLLTSKPTIFACNVAESDLAVVAARADRGHNGSLQSSKPRSATPATARLRMFARWRIMRGTISQLKRSSSARRSRVNSSILAKTRRWNICAVSVWKTAACTHSFAPSIICLACARFSLLAKRRRAHGQFTPATKRPPPRALSIPISSVVLLPRKQFIQMIWPLLVPSPKPVKLESCEVREKITSCATAT